MVRLIVYAILLREGQSRLRDFDWMSKRRVRRCVRCCERAWPGELLHVGVEKQGKILSGGGWRTRGGVGTSR